MMTYPYEAMVERHLDVRARAGVEWQCLCPFHDDSSPSFSVNVSKGLFICYACGAKGNGDALAKKLGARPTSDSLPDSLDSILSKIEQYAESKKPAQHKRVDGEAWMHQYRIGDFWYEAWQDRMGSDFSSSLADRFALGYDHVRDALVIPIFDWNGSAEGCVKRRIGQIEGPKYIYSKGFKTSQHLYGAWQVRAEYPTRRPPKVAIVEGTIDALSMWAVGIPAVALLGSQVSAQQRILLKRLDAVEYVVMTDRDTAGAKADLLIHQSLKGSGSLVSRPTWWLQGAKDVAEMVACEREKSFSSSAVKALTRD